MSNKQTVAVLRHIRLLAGQERNDEELLRSFAERRDENAFSALVQRHGPLVQRVCQCALHHCQDAEDAFQATFLVLARQAGSIRKRQSLASWLHGVAYRLSMQLRRSAARRRTHEKQVKTMPRRSPCDELSWREVQAILHEEVARLPSKYQDAFVLCCLEGISRVDAARKLGLCEGTVSSRLAQARKLLQARLNRRGVSLAGVLGIAALSPRARAAVPPSLLRATVELALSPKSAGAAATCAAAARIITLAKGVEQTMSASKFKVVLSFLLVLCLVPAGLGVPAAPSPARPAEALTPTASDSPGMAPRRAGAQQPGRSPTSAAVKGELETITVKGRVLGPDDKVFGGARLYLGHYGPNDEVAVTERAQSNADGRFEFRFPKSQLSKVHPDQLIGSVFGMYTLERLEPPLSAEADPLFTPIGQVMAVAEGVGCDWSRIDPAPGRSEMTLKLVKDVPIRGRILDPEGKPVAGAKLRPTRIRAYPGEDLTAALAEFRKSNDFPIGSKLWGGPLPGQPRTVTTGSDGSFRMAGLGSERLVILRVEGPAIASTDIPIMTRVSDEVAGPDKLGEGRYTVAVKPERVYGATFRYLAPASRPIRGMVTDKQTGKRLAGVLIRVGPSNRSSGTMTTSDGMLTTRTDEEGRYEVVGCPKSSRYEIFAQPTDTSHYFSVRLQITDISGVGPLTSDIQLPGGIPIRGRVIDERTGKPVPGARVHCYPDNLNPSIRALEGCGNAESSAIADPDGFFAVTALSGPCILGAVAPDSTVHARSKAYREGELTDKEIDDFFNKYKLPPDEAERMKRMKKAIIVKTTGSADQWHLFRRDSFNSLVLIHPDEKDKELKQDLKLRPNRWAAKARDESSK